MTTKLLHTQHHDTALGILTVCVYEVIEKELIFGEIENFRGEVLALTGTYDLYEEKELVSMLEQLISEYKLLGAS